MVLGQQEETLTEHETDRRRGYLRRYLVYLCTCSTTVLPYFWAFTNTKKRISVANLELQPNDETNPMVNSHGTKIWVSYHASLAISQSP